MPQFRLVINLGNDAMKTPLHVRDALVRVVQQFPYDESTSELAQRGRRKIYDINGNVVGHYEVRE